MPRYDYILLDADMTLFDFERSEEEALKEVLTAHGYPTDRETLDLYQRINSALWDANARGKIDQDFLTVERFAAFMRVKGGGHDPRQFNRDYLASLGRHGYLLPGAEDFCRALPQPLLLPGHFPLPDMDLLDQEQTVLHLARRKHLLVVGGQLHRFA